MRMIMIGLVAIVVGHEDPAQLGSILKRAQQFRDLQITNEEEVQIGDAVSARIRTRYGVVQDEAIHRYVGLVGRVIAQKSGRAGIAYRFIVLDTDGVNAFASPGGFVHITRGALGLIRTEGELAAVLGHEIAHVAHRHTIDAIRKANAEKLLSEAALSDRGPYLNKVADLAYDNVLEPPSPRARRVSPVEPRRNPARTTRRRKTTRTSSRRRKASAWARSRSRCRPTSHPRRWRRRAALAESGRTASPRAATTPPSSR